MLKVIGAGFGRTGTESMKTALEMLGFGPCFHMHEVMANPDRVTTWRAISRGEPADWDAVFAGYQASVDWPAAFFWRELAAHFPDAKVLLTYRDPEDWYASMEKTILPVLRKRAEGTVGELLIAQRVFGGEVEDKDAVIAAYIRNTQEVQAAFGPDRLLTFAPGDGWGPLCAPVPDMPYPHKNQPAAFQEKLEALTRARTDQGGD